MIRAVLASTIAALLAIGAAARASPPSLEAYGRLPAISLMRLSPAGDRLALITVDRDARKLVVGPVGGAATDVLDVGAAKVRDLEWAGDDHVLVTVSATVNLGIDYDGTYELTSVIVLNTKTHKSFGVFSGSRSVTPAVFGQYGEVEEGGHWYGYFGAITAVDSGSGHYISADRTFPDLYRVNLDNGRIDLVAGGQPNISGWLVRPDGEVAAHSLYDEKTAEWRIVAGAGAGQLLASGHDTFSGVDLSWGRTPETLMFQRSTDKGVVFTEIPLAGGAPLASTPNDHVAEPIADLDQGLWIGAVEDDAAQSVRMFDARRQARIAAARKAFPDNYVHLESWSADFNRLLVLTDGGTDSGSYWLVDIATGSAKPLGALYPEVTEASVGRVSVIDYHAADGLALQGVLTLPPGGEPKDLPLVTLPHGGPEARDYLGFDWWAQAFAAQGYAVWQPNFRGSSGYGVKFRDAGFGQWGRKMQTDISDGVAELARRGIVDAKRVCIVGASYGGYAALAGVTIQQGVYRCAVSVAGVSDLGALIAFGAGHSDAGYRGASTRFWMDFMGVTSPFSPTLNAIAPIKQAEHADAPILLIHGLDDTVVPIGQSRAMAAALRRAGKPVELVTMHGEDHWLSREETRTAMLKASVAFVEKYDPPDAAPIPRQSSTADPATH